MSRRLRFRRRARRKLHLRVHTGTAFKHMVISPRGSKTRSSGRRAGDNQSFRQSRPEQRRIHRGLDQRKPGNPTAAAREDPSKSRPTWLIMAPPASITHVQMAVDDPLEPPVRSRRVHLSSQFWARAWGPRDRSLVAKRPVAAINWRMVSPGRMARYRFGSANHDAGTNELRLLITLLSTTGNLCTTYLDSFLVESGPGTHWQIGGTPRGIAIRVRRGPNER